MESTSECGWRSQQRRAVVRRWTKRRSPAEGAEDLVRDCLKCGRPFHPVDGVGRPSRFVRLCPECHAFNSVDLAGSMDAYPLAGAHMGIDDDLATVVRPTHCQESVAPLAVLLDTVDDAPCRLPSLLRPGWDYQEYRKLAG